MIHHTWDLFYGIHNTITEHNERQTYLLSIGCKYRVWIHSEMRT